MVEVTDLVCTHKLRQRLQARQPCLLEVAERVGDAVELFHVVGGVCGDKDGRISSARNDAGEARIDLGGLRLPGRRYISGTVIPMSTQAAILMVLLAIVLTTATPDLPLSPAAHDLLNRSKATDQA